MVINYEILIRILVSVVLGAILGLEREFKECPAGLRTHSLVCIGATVFTLASIAFAGPGVDVSRIAGQVVVGIGFIGAGVIFKEKDKVVGLTTAATLWIAAGIGIMAAINQFFIAALVTVISVIVLSGGFWLEKNVLHKKKSRLKP
ncbi:MgtC/SapB family protein [Candidatus Woesearchaeota archaeon]|nr:MgtC/SapB family protein [Candidatus Woesearchaeota archaeon]